MKARCGINLGHLVPKGLGAGNAVLVIECPQAIWRSKEPGSVQPSHQRPKPFRALR